MYMFDKRHIDYNTFLTVLIDLRLRENERLVPEQFNADIKIHLAKLMAIVDEIVTNELREQIKITTSDVTEEQLSTKRFQEKKWISGETLD